MMCVCLTACSLFSFFFFNDTATTEIYTLSLHDALPISVQREGHRQVLQRHLLEDLVERPLQERRVNVHDRPVAALRSEEHTSELQSRLHLVCRLLLEKKKKNTIIKRSNVQRATYVKECN